MTAPRVVAAMVLCLGGAWPVAAAAQAPPQAPRVPRSEIAMTAGFVGPVSFGSADASITRPGGTPLVLFETENRLAPGFAMEVHIGRQLTSRLMVEGTGIWHRADFETRVSSDIEDAESATLTQAGSRFGVEGALLWTVLERGDMSVFARGGAGWMRELAGHGGLVEDGAIGAIGGGVKYWLVHRPGARLARIGFRVEGRVDMRSAAITLGERKLRIAPLVTGGVVFRF